MAERGSTGNVVAGIASFFLPGLGQLVQGRVTAAVVFFLFATVLWLITFGVLGWIANLWACIDAAVYDDTGSRPGGPPPGGAFGRY